MEAKVIAASVLIMALLSGCLSDSGNPGAVSVKIISVGEKDMVCHSGESITLNVTVKSSALLDNVTVSIEGLKNKIGQMKIHKYRVVELVRGINIIPFECRVPLCSSCNRLDPGVYQVRATVSRNGEILAEGSGTMRLEM